jgi:hypothetical protein
MANVSGQGTLWNLPNFAGQLFTPSHVQTPFLDMIAQMGTVSQPEFAMSSRYDQEAASQPGITETASLTAPTATGFVRTNEKNVAQIFQEQVSVSYAKLSAADRIKRVEVSTSGFAYDEAGENPIQDELAFQIQANINQIKMDLEYSVLNGTYQLGTDAGTAFKMRGIITGSTTNTVAAGGVDITRTIMDSLFKEMADNGAFSQNGVFTIFCNSWNKQQLTNAYDFVPMDRELGGSNIQRIMTDFGDMNIIYVPRVPAATILVANMSEVAMVFQPVANKPVNDNLLILEPLSKTGASENWQLFGQMGIDYGSSYFHGTVTGTSTS